MKGGPLVSVVMPVYGVERYVGEAVQSVLQQTLTDFELIVVDDASPDRSIDTVLSFADPRIRVIRHAQNRGLSAARNTGLQAARAPCIALLDSDDVSPPTRLARQSQALAADPGLVACGGWMRYMDTQSRLFGPLHRAPTSAARLPGELLFHNTFYVSSMMFRREAIASMRYRTDFPMAEDYEFMVRLSRQGRLANLPELLLHYRTHGASLTATKPRLMGACRRRIAAEQLKRLGISASNDELSLHLRAGMPEPGLNREALQALRDWLLRLQRANLRHCVYDAQAFQEVLAAIWFEACTKASDLGLWAYRLHASSSLRVPGVVALQRQAKFFLKTAAGWAPRPSRLSGA